MLFVSSPLSFQVSRTADSVPPEFERAIGRTTLPSTKLRVQIPLTLLLETESTSTRTLGISLCGAPRIASP